MSNSARKEETPDEELKGDSRDPSGFLSEIIGAPVTVKLNSGIIYKGLCILSISRLTSKLLYELVLFPKSLFSWPFQLLIWLSMHKDMQNEVVLLSVWS